MRCPFCGVNNTWCSTRYENQPHTTGCSNFGFQCIREKWRCNNGHEFTLWACEGKH